jgi:hypothetical protein
MVETPQIDWDSERQMVEARHLFLLDLEQCANLILPLVQRLDEIVNQIDQEGIWDLPQNSLLPLGKHL